MLTLSGTSIDSCHIGTYNTLDFQPFIGGIVNKYIVNNFLFFYGISKFDSNCNFLNPSKDTHSDPWGNK